MDKHVIKRHPDKPELGDMADIKANMPSFTTADGHVFQIPAAELGISHWDELSAEARGQEAHDHEDGGRVPAGYHDKQWEHDRAIERALRAHDPAAYEK